MLEVLVLVIALALADAVNPLTIAGALYIATSDAARPAGVAFTGGVFTVYAGGGAVLLLGPGQLLDDLTAGAQSTTFHAGSLVAGALLLIVAVVLARRRRARPHVMSVQKRLTARSALALGASVTLLDLPTAFPYFAAIGAIAESRATVAGQLLMLLAFNLIYALPLVVIVTARALAGERALRVLRRSRELIDRVAPRIVSALTAVTGGALIWRGAAGILA
ncbi:MAG: GAP family protein [Solirubrobacteraceae bacterium]